MRFASTRRRVRFDPLPIVLAVAAAILTVSSVAAAGCYDPNRGAGIEYQVSGGKGLQGVVDLVSAQPANPSTTAIVHPAQIVMASGDFVGWGTAKGVGIDDCPTYTGTRWQLYVDGFAFATYFCRQAYGSEPDVASNQSFEIRHTTCNGMTRWAFFWNSSLKTCQTVDGVAGYPSVGGESIGTNPQTIDVHYESLQYRVLGGSWINWGSNRVVCEDASWYDASGSGTSYWVVRK